MQEPAPSFWRATFLHRCPACGKAPMYDGVLKIRDACPSCGFHLGEHDSGDGLAFFVITIVGTIVAMLATWLELTYEPPFWLHAVILAPVTLFLSLWLLRVFKSGLIWLQYRHRLGAFEEKEEDRP